MTDTINLRAPSERVRLLLGGGAVRAAGVQLNSDWESALAKKNLPVAAQSLLGEMAAAACLLAATLKFEGALVLQLRGSGSVRVAVAECRQGQFFRAAMSLAPDAIIAPDASFQTLANFADAGQLAVVLDPLGRQPGQQPYTGIVPLIGESLSAVLEH